jgi:hypothetical protein
MSSVNAYCSWCYNMSEHRLIEKNIATRNVYACTKCSNKTLICRYCREMSKGKLNDSIIKGQNFTGVDKLTQSWSNELCAEHDGSIASFPNLAMKISDISDYEKIFVRKKKI